MTTPDPTPAPLEIPSISKVEFLKDRYSDFEKLGSGGMGTVFKAYDSVLAIPVAIKLLNHESLSGIQVIRFQQEAKAASRFSHPSLISIFDFGQGPDGQLYLVMEYIEGQSLLELIEKSGGIEDEQRVYDLLLSLARAISYIHGENVIHRDIKPSNVMLLEDGSIKVIDFGVAKMDSSDDDQSLTATGIAIGSPAYMSPEQVHGLTIDARSDIYSFGCLLHAILTGKPVFEADNSLNVMSMQIDYQLPSLSENCKHAFAHKLEPIYRKLTEKDPDNRYQSFDEIINDIQSLKEEALEAVDEQTEQEDKEYKPSTDIKSGISIKQTTLMIALLVIVGLLGYAYLGNNDQPAIVSPEPTMVVDVVPKDKDANPPFELKEIRGKMRWTSTDVETFKDEDFKWLSKKFERAGHKPKTIVLNLNATKINGSGFKYLQDYNVTDIACSSSDLNDEAMKYIASYPNLVTLKVAGSKITDQGLSYLKGNSLDSIDLNGCRGVTNKGIRRLIKNCPKVRKLRFGGTSTNAAILKDLSNLKRLHEVDLIFSNLKDSDLIPLVKIKTLQDYDLGGNADLTDRAVDILYGCDKLVYLNLHGCYKITPKAVNKLQKKFPDLKIEDDIKEIKDAQEGLDTLMKMAPDNFLPDYKPL